MKLLLYSGIFYMLGIFLSSNIINTKNNNFRITENLNFASRSDSKLLFLISLSFTFFLILPIILLGAQTQGFYFTTLLFTSALYRIRSFTIDV